MVLLFPGQGSQSPGMGKFLWENFSAAKTVFEEASDALSFDLKKLCFDSDAATLSLTANTQPAILTVSVAAYRSLQQEKPFDPRCTAGHSIGEYGSLVAAGVMNFSDAVRAVRLRGQFMQESVPVGAGGMVALLGATWQQAEKLCAWVKKQMPGEVLSPANDNSPGQIVLAGSTPALEALKKIDPSQVLLEPVKFKFIPLQVSAPFHCSMMLPAQERMEGVLEEIVFKDAKFPIIQNLTAKPETTALQLKTNLIQQISSPVRWVESMLELKKIQDRKCIECGSGKVLAGLLKKIDSEYFEVLSLNSLDEFKLIISAI